MGVQPEAQDFTVHEGLISARSEFFRNALKVPWKESEERTIPLPEDEPKVFPVYLKLLYVSLGRPAASSTLLIAYYSPTQCWSGNMGEITTLRQ